MPRAAFVYDDAMSQHVLRPDHPMRPIRLRHTFELLDAYGAFDSDDSLLVTPTLADEATVGEFHSRDYMAAVRTFSLGLTGFQPQRFGFAQGGDNPTYPGMYEAALLSTGATLTAARMVADGEVSAAFNISGGLHHAAARQASGFCVFNDPVVAIKYLLNRGRRVAYVDIDAHHGDGVQDAFYDEPRVLTISVHESGQYLFPGTGFAGETGAGAGVGYAVNLPLYPYTDDEIYLDAFEAVVPPLLQAFAPDVLLTQLGIDSYHTDPLTHLQVTSRGFTAAVERLGGLGYPWLATGGGGYDLGAVARCWTLAYGVMCGAEWPDRVPPAAIERLGRNNLRDTEIPEIPANVRADARALADESVAAIRDAVFPAHGLTP
jgi:acetoin utilization protein AcuC